jgi:succinoglycan biosynthesis protein ExoM
MKHIAVCICTFKRAAFLKRLLTDLGQQETEGLFTFSVVVADNDREESAKAVVAEVAAASPVAIRYCVQPQQNIALTRNKAIENAEGDFVAFIDDDEFPTKQWLLTLFKAWQTHGVDGVLGPVKPHYNEEPPAWVVKGGFYDRPSYPTGFVIDWRKGRTGNVLLDRKVFEGLEGPFRPEFLTGEDQDFFRRAIEKGHCFIWCHEAIAYEEASDDGSQRRGQVGRRGGGLYLGAAVRVDRRRARVHAVPRQAVRPRGAADGVCRYLAGQGLVRHGIVEAGC